MHKSVAAALIGLGVLVQANAAVLSPAVDDNTFTARIEAVGVSAELILRFEKAVGLTVENLGISVQVIDPLDGSLWDRFPDGVGLADDSLRTNVVFRDRFDSSVQSGSSGSSGVPALGFPLLITVEPVVTSGFAFEGVYEIELYTRSLHYFEASPLRLFSAATSNDMFQDITEMITGGSYRTRASGGHFSEFMILADDRPTADVVSIKFDRLETLLTLYNLPGSLPVTLTTLLATAKVAWLAGEPGDAMTAIEAFAAAVLAAETAGEVPNVWGAAHNLVNAAGELRSAARTLRFSLSQAANGY